MSKSYEKLKQGREWSREWTEEFLDWLLCELEQKKITKKEVIKIILDSDEKHLDDIEKLKIKIMKLKIKIMKLKLNLRTNHV